MTPTSRDTEALAEQVRVALTERDLDAFGALLSSDVHWGDGDHPRACRNRKEVLTTMASALARGIDGKIGEIVPGTKGILCRLDIDESPDDRRRLSQPLYHVYMVREGRIVVIEAHHDRPSAAIAAGVR